MRTALVKYAASVLLVLPVAACMVGPGDSGGGATAGLTACEAFEQTVDSCLESAGPIRCTGEPVAHCLLATHIDPCRIEFHYDELTAGEKAKIDACSGKM